MKKYECTKDFVIDQDCCDEDDDFFETDEDFLVKKGSQWIDHEKNYLFMELDVRLWDDNGNWIETTKEGLAGYFKEIG
ncbi:MAG: hypothetical protein ABF969_11945 [Sporolactobacillus sp.]